MLSVDDHELMDAEQLDLEKLSIPGCKHFPHCSVAHKHGPANEKKIPFKNYIYKSVFPTDFGKN